MAKRRDRKKHPNSYAQVDALVRKDIIAIATHRFGTATLPDTAEGRRFLRAMLAKRLPVTQAYEIAPWCPDELCRMAAEVAADPRAPTRDRLGDMIEFEFDELTRMSTNRYAVRHVAPFDAQPYQVQEFFRAKRLVAEAKRQSRRRKRPARKEEQMEKRLSKRTRAVYEALNGDWTSAADIIRAVEPKFQPRKRGAVLRRAVHHVLDELIKLGLAEDKIEHGQHGFPTRFVRRAQPATTKTESKDVPELLDF
jgi:hypothetical protein